jgi:Na+/melibiose symporter-like transporter
MTIYTLTMMAYTLWMHPDVLQSSLFAHCVSGSIGIVLMAYAWCYLLKRQRGRLRFAVEEKNLIVITPETWIQKLSRIRRNFPAMQWLIITLLFSPNTGSGSYFSVFSTIQISLIQMNSSQIAACSLVSLLSTLLGTRVSSYVCDQFDPLISFRGSILIFLLAIIGTVLFVSGPQQIPLYFVFAAIEGISLGWIVPTERVLLCSLTFLDESETLGLILCLHTLAAWLPPFLFTAINQVSTKQYLSCCLKRECHLLNCFPDLVNRF